MDTLQEQKVGFDGRLETSENNSGIIQGLFHETSKGILVPRSVICDTDDFVINKIGKGVMGELFWDKLFTRGYDSADVCSEVYYCAIPFIESILEGIRKELEKCESFDSYLFIGHVSGASSGGIMWTV